MLTYSISYGSIAALQNVRASNGEAWTAIYMSESAANPILVEKSGTSTRATLPDEVMCELLYRFDHVFSQPAERREVSVQRMRQVPIDVSVKCDACSAVGMLHCSDPTSCGGPWSD